MYHRWLVSGSLTTYKHMLKLREEEEEKKKQSEENSNKIMPVKLRGRGEKDPSNILSQRSADDKKKEFMNPLPSLNLMKDGLRVGSQSDKNSPERKNSKKVMGEGNQREGRENLEDQKMSDLFLLISNNPTKYEEGSQQDLKKETGKRTENGSPMEKRTQEKLEIMRNSPPFSKKKPNEAVRIGKWSEAASNSMKEDPGI